MVKISLNLGSQVKTFGPLIQKVVLGIVNWNENKVIIVLNIMNWNEKRVQILWVQELEWKEGKIFQRKRTGEPWNENVDPLKVGWQSGWEAFNGFEPHMVLSVIIKNKPVCYCRIYQIHSFCWKFLLKLYLSTLL